MALLGAIPNFEECRARSWQHHVSLSWGVIETVAWRAVVGTPSGVRNTARGVVDTAESSHDSQRRARLSTAAPHDRSVANARCTYRQKSPHYPHRT